jgi:hypothetical protein
MFVPLIRDVRFSPLPKLIMFEAWLAARFARRHFPWSLPSLLFTSAILQRTVSRKRFPLRLFTR